MTISANIAIAQNMLLFRKQPNGGTPVVFTVRCNCGSSPREQTARFVDSHRHLFVTPEDFKAGKWE